MPKNVIFCGLAGGYGKPGGKQRTLKLAEHLDADDLKAAINRELPEGINITNIEKVFFIREKNAVSRRHVFS